ncbi:MAG: BREX-6 system adenine-specific DNA-methyltransferase PglX [Proteobacteria bacterium]|nr:BREX-6 system adenine-specific DNA-methyltransferase PglX [Pseudomonadota bacterium]
MSMTRAARRALSVTIRALRIRLLDDLHASTETAYRLSLRVRDAGLAEPARLRRARLDAWTAEQIKAQTTGTGAAMNARTADDFRREAEKQAAYTLLNRLVIVRLMEASGPGGEPMRAPALVTGGWESKAYKDFRQLAPAVVRADASEGYGFLLRLVFEELAMELPGVYGEAGVAELIPIPAATLRHVVQALDAPELASCWTDDMTLGWVYQYWNDPEREALDARLHGGGKLEPHEIASKTQMFTERYMVDWLLHNSLGPVWLAMCKKHGWTPEVVAAGTLDAVEARRVEWRARRDTGEVSLAELMPLHTDAERRWAYYVPQPIPDDAVEHAPDSVRELRILDPAVGSGHFLVVAVDLLVALYREEAQHRGEVGQKRWTDRAIIERILSHNLHGIDIEPRAVQIAAAALWLKARQIAPDAQPTRLNLVASDLRLASLADDDSGLVELRREVERETGIPGQLTDTIVGALRGADYLGSLLKVDRAVDEAIQRHEASYSSGTTSRQAMRSGVPTEPNGRAAGYSIDRARARAALLGRIEGFLARRSGGHDLGLRPCGEQLAAGARFLRLVQEGTYDMVVANPPYQGTSKMTRSRYVETHYPLGKADLYAAFMLRGLELVRDGGISAMLTMRNWMFIKQYTGLRQYLLEHFDLRALGDFDRGAFEYVPDEVVSVAANVIRKCSYRGDSIAVCPTPRQDVSRDSGRTSRKRAATLCQVGRHEFKPDSLRTVPGAPLVYWWTESDVEIYNSAPLVGDACPARFGLTTGDNDRFCRFIWEPLRRDVVARPGDHAWAPLVHGARGAKWMDPAHTVIKWARNGLEVKVKSEFQYGTVSRQIRNVEFYFRRGIAFSAIGNKFAVRAHRLPSVFSNAGLSLFPADVPAALAALASSRAVRIANDLAPGIRFDVGDINRIPLFAVDGAETVFDVLEHEFAVRESHRETSIEFCRPGPESWRHAQEWAQRAVDRAASAPLEPYQSECDVEPPGAHLSFALGVALGRFDPDGKGILDPTTADLSHASPAGILFLDRTLDRDDRRDGLGHPAAAHLHEGWARYGPALGSPHKSLREWLAGDFFKDIHKGMYDNRPIHWPLSSATRTFVAWVNIHRFTGQTLRILLADHLYPTLSRLDGELTDLRVARDRADRDAARSAEKQYDRVIEARDELQVFIDDVEQYADRGPLPTEARCPAREIDARHGPDLDDGVMINAAALWKLLEPQWKDPKNWWHELAAASGKKDHDWSHLAMRYWPTRVDAKCQKDPSLSVAHGCFWRYHPDRAWAWELRLQDEIAPDFRIVEAPYRPGGRDLGDQGDSPHRTAWLRDHARQALAAVARETHRRRRRGKDAEPISEMRIAESGLWSALPRQCWDLELDLIARQGQDFRLLAPDEHKARAELLSDNPQLAAERERLLDRMQPNPPLSRKPAEEGQ